MLKVSATEALAVSKNNVFCRWSGAEQSAVNRLRSSICVPFVQPTFQIGKNDRIFAIGSCFARNVEEQLAIYHSEPLSATISIPGATITSARSTGVVNKYNVLSMEQEIAWAAGVSTFPKEAFLRVRAEEFYDPHLRKVIPGGPVHELERRRRYVRKYFARSLACDVSIITLGLAEYWFDEETGLALNEMPDRVSLKRSPTRFSFCIAEVSDVLASLERIYALLRSYGRPNSKIIVTTSPIPFSRTFTQHDVIVANLHSKSILRIASLEFANRHADVDYYPSYESALVSDQRIVWANDRLHVSDFMVGQLIHTFLRRYGLSVDALPAEEQRLPDETGIAAMRKQVDSYKKKIVALNREVSELKDLQRRAFAGRLLRRVIG